MLMFLLRSYASATNQQEAAAQARADLPFLFKAFETGQIGPKRMAKMHGGKPRMATIHEYLDWTLTAQAAQEDDELVGNLDAVQHQCWCCPWQALLQIPQQCQPSHRVDQHTCRTLVGSVWSSSFLAMYHTGLTLDL
jgi:hypothetical protein